MLALLTVISVVLAPSETPSTDRLRRLLSWAWEPLASTALVVVVMIFALLRILRAQGMDARHIKVETISSRWRCAARA